MNTVTVKHISPTDSSLIKEYKATEEQLRKANFFNDLFDDCGVTDSVEVKFKYSMETFFKFLEYHFSNEPKDDEILQLESVIGHKIYYSGLNEDKFVEQLQLESLLDCLDYRLDLIAILYTFPIDPEIIPPHILEDLVTQHPCQVPLIYHPFKKIATGRYYSDWLRNRTNKNTPPGCSYSTLKTVAKVTSGRQISITRKSGNTDFEVKLNSRDITLTKYDRTGDVLLTREVLLSQVKTITYYQDGQRARELINSNEHDVLLKHWNSSGELIEHKEWVNMLTNTVTPSEATAREATAREATARRSVTQKQTNTDNRGCPYIFSKGFRTGLVCGVKSRLGNKYCSKHNGYILTTVWGKR